MLGPASNPYASPAAVAAEPSTKQFRRPRFRDLFRGALSDVRWSDQNAALRTGLRVLLVAMATDLARVRGLQLLFSLAGTRLGGSLGFLTPISVAVRCGMLFGLVYLYRGTPVRYRRFATVCLVAWLMNALIGPVVAWAMQSGIITIRSVLFWTLPGTVSRFAYVVARQLWLRRLALADSTKRLAVIGLMCQGGLVLLGVFILLIPSLRGALTYTPPVPWHVTVLMVGYAVVQFLDVVVVARVLGETIGSIEVGSTEAV